MSLTLDYHHTKVNKKLFGGEQKKYFQNKYTDYDNFLLQPQPQSVFFAVSDVNNNQLSSKKKPPHKKKNVISRSALVKSLNSKNHFINERHESNRSSPKGYYSLSPSLGAEELPFIPEADYSIDGSVKSTATSAGVECFANFPSAFYANDICYKEDELQLIIRPQIPKRRQNIMLIPMQFSLDNDLFASKVPSKRHQLPCWTPMHDLVSSEDEDEKSEARFIEDESLNSRDKDRELAIASSTIRFTLRNQIRTIIENKKLRQVSFFEQLFGNRKAKMDKEC